ncbi:MAG: methyltransferase [Magnetococcales bacterium]|nr:methyltransferase [Magnetococcales bacterium]
MSIVETAVWDEGDPLCRKVGESEDGLRLAHWMVSHWQQSGLSTLGQRWLELGTGCGAVAVEIARQIPECTIDALEIQPSLVERAQARVRFHQLTQRVRVLEADLRNPPREIAETAYAAVFANPPYYPVGRGRVPPDPIRAQARFEYNGTVAEFIQRGASQLVPGGVFGMVLRPERLPESLALLESVDLFPSRMRPLYHDDHASKGASLVLVMAVYGRKQVFTITR